MAYDYSRSISTADRLITKFGAKAYLRRAGVDRECFAAVTDIIARDDTGQIMSPLSVIVLISAKGLTVPPDWQVDSLKLKDPKTAALKEQRMTAEETAIAPAGVAVYWECKVKK